MLVGIISDTHDDMAAIKSAVSLFTEKSVTRVLHAGDLTSPFTFDLFSLLQCQFAAVFGNNDGDRLMLAHRSSNTIFPQPYVTTLNGLKLVMVHEPDLVSALADSGHFDIVIYGHTHRAEIRRNNKTLIINPGKTARLHKGESTVVLLDTSAMEAEIVPL